MNILDIHTHTPRRDAIVNCYPQDFSPQPGYFYSVGIHPWYIPNEGLDALKEQLAAEVRHPQVLAIGETGLDRLAAATIELQADLFRFHCQIAETVRKPVIIHLVKAVDQLLRLKSDIRPSVPWIIHGFRGKPELARELLRHGFYLSFGEKYQPAALQSAPADRLFLETDTSTKSIEDLICRAAVTRDVDEKALREIIRKNVQSVFASVDNVGA